MNQLPDNWYLINEIDELDSPALLVYPARVRQNIDAAVKMVMDVQWLRPHVKTSKCRETVLMMMDAGITKFKCATIAEAETLGMCGAPDVLLAYQPTGPKLHRFVAVIKKYPATLFACLADNIVAAQQMALVFSAAGLSIRLFIDVNVGMNRTGILPGEDLLHLYSACGKLAGIQPVGLHAYDGHIRSRHFAEKTQLADEAFAKVDQMQQLIMAKGFPRPVIVMGGSPTFSVHCKRSGVECSPGTFVYWDKGYSDLCPEQPFVPAVLVISRIISFPTATRICTDLGHKSVAAENEIERRVFFLNASNLQPISQSEEHLVLEAGTEHIYTVGQVLYGLPLHVCPTVALYERAITIEAGKITGEWKTIARDRKIEV